MINNNSNNSTTTKGTVILQTEVLPATKDFLKLEALVRRVTMGELINELVEQYQSLSVPKKTS